MQGLTAEQHSKLKGVLSYETAPAMNFYTKTFSSTMRTMLSKRGDFPTGLLYLVLEWLTIASHKYETVDLRIKPKSKEGLFTLNLGYTPYRSQIEAAKAGAKSQRGIISAPTGLGKSTIVALLIDRLQVKTLIVVPNLELKRQLSESLRAAFGSLANITVENIDSNAIKKKKDYDLLIIDEFHHSAAKTYRTLNKKVWNNIYYKIGLTATPFRSQSSEKMLLESVLSNIIYEIRYEDAVTQGHIVPMEAYYYEIEKKVPKGHTWAQIYNELVVNNQERNDLIGELIASLNTNKISNLCLVKEIAHGNNLSELTGAAFANGQDDDKVMLIKGFNARKIKSLIGTSGVLGEGVDTKPAEYVIIAGLGKSKTAFMQQVGRGFRNYPGKESCKIILFYDRSHKWTREHFKTQCRILLEEFGVVPVKIS